MGGLQEHAMATSRLVGLVGWSGSSTLEKERLVKTKVKGLECWLTILPRICWLCGHIAESRTSDPENSIAVCVFSSLFSLSGLCSGFRFLFLDQL